MKCKILKLSYILLLLCFTASCGATKNNISNDTLSRAGMESETEDEDEATSTDTVKDDKVVEESIYPLSIPDEEKKSETFEIFVVLRGYLFSSKEVKLSYDEKEVQESEISLTLVNEVSNYLGIPLSLNDIHYLNDVVTIDFKSTSFPLQGNFETFTDTLLEYNSYDEMTFSILDSIWLTMQNYFGEDISVVYQMDGEDLKLNKLRMKVDFASSEKYMGYLYYENQYIKRNEELDTDEIRLHMSYNDIIEILFDQEQKFTQEVDLSVLGDQSNWTMYKDVDEYLKHAWTQIELIKEGQELYFDGPDTLLVRIINTSNTAKSRRGLLIGDTLKRLLELYGEEYLVFEATNYNIYEFSLLDHYFIAEVDKQRKRVVNFGVSTYSQQEIVDGYKILDTIYEKELKISQE